MLCLKCILIYISYSRLNVFLTLRTFLTLSLLLTHIICSTYIYIYLKKGETSSN